MTEISFFDIRPSVVQQSHQLLIVVHNFHLSRCISIISSIGSWRISTVSHTNARTHTQIQFVVTSASLSHYNTHCQQFSLQAGTTRLKNIARTVELVCRAGNYRFESIQIDSAIRIDSTERMRIEFRSTSICLAPCKAGTSSACLLVTKQALIALYHKFKVY